MIGQELDSVPRKKSEPLDVSLNRMVLKPVTKIMRFEGIMWTMLWPEKKAAIVEDSTRDPKS